MQSLSWYAKRLSAMSPGEVAWRIRGTIRDVSDRALARRRAGVRSPRSFLDVAPGDATPGFRVSEVAVGELASGSGVRQVWCDRLRERADQIAANRLSFFDLEDCHLGDPIDWNRDHKRGIAAPLTHAPAIDYRDVRVAGDCKFVWEPNRHHQLVVLARAYRATGELRYASAVVTQLDGWMKACPFGFGMNWRSPLELGVRLINWVWAIDMIRESGLVCGTFRERLLCSVHRHVWDITRKYSRASSANNHLVGEAAGVFIATCYFTGLKNARRWRQQSHEILCHEIEAQAFPDGGTREQALGYLLFVLQFFLYAGIAARRVGEDFPASYWNRLAKMLTFVTAMAEGGWELPLFGDCDDGYVLDLGHPGECVRELLAIGAVLFEDEDFGDLAGVEAEPVYWLFGGEPATAASSAKHRPPARIASRSFPESGYFLLQSGHRQCDDRISVLFDCGPLGYGPLAAHGHADALSFTMRVGGRDVLVDPGTFDYFSYPAWRQYFRSTRAHNTITVDGRDQSEMLGLFLWGRRATATCTRFEAVQHGGRVSGRHDGYGHLADPVIHTRSLELDGETGSLVVRDDLTARQEHEIELNFHLAEHCTVRSVSDNRVVIDSPGGGITFAFDARLSLEHRSGSESPIAGWVSRGYHRRSVATTLSARATIRGTTSLLTEIAIDQGEMSKRQTAESQRYLVGVPRRDS